VYNKQAREARTTTLATEQLSKPKHEVEVVLSVHLLAYQTYCSNHCTHHGAVEAERHEEEEDPKPHAGARLGRVAVRGVLGVPTPHEERHSAHDDSYVDVLHA